MAPRKSRGRRHPAASPSLCASPKQGPENNEDVAPLPHQSIPALLLLRVDAPNRPACACLRALAGGARMEVTLEFQESMFGAEKVVEMRHLETCGVCKGSGAKDGTAPSVCPGCSGMGQVMQTRQTSFGIFSQVPPPT